MLVRFIKLSFKVSKGAEATMPFTVYSPETVRDGVVIEPLLEPLLEIERDDAFLHQY